MNRRVLAAIFLLAISLFAQDSGAPKSHFVTQVEGAYSKIYFSRDGDYNYRGNGYFLAQFGREFRLAKYFSLTPLVGVARNGWSFEHIGKEGRISLVDPFISASVNAHPFVFGYVDFGFKLGFPTYCFGNIDGQKTTVDFPYFGAKSVEYYLHAGADFKKNFRGALAFRFTVVDADSYPTIDFFSLGASVAYLF